MHPADIKAAIEKAGSSQRAIALDCAVTPSTVAHLIHGRGVSAKVAEAIAAITRLPLHQLWPARYPAPAAQPVPPRKQRAVANAAPIREAA